MIEQLIQLTVLFLVIFDPLASLAVFFSATAKMKKTERKRIAFLAVSVASIVSLVFLFFGQDMLSLLNTTLDEFRVAGGIVLIILGIKMALGHPPGADNLKSDSGIAVASIIGTPLLTGPAAITAIIISTHDFGLSVTGLALVAVLLLTAFLFFEAEKVRKYFGDTSVRLLSTVMGLVTIAWGVRFIASGLQAIFPALA
jgi:multiple antibiotic resistance protein